MKYLRISQDVINSATNLRKKPKAKKIKNISTLQSSRKDIRLARTLGEVAMSQITCFEIKVMSRSN